MGLTHLQAMNDEREWRILSTYLSQVMRDIVVSLTKIQGREKLQHCLRHVKLNVPLVTTIQGDVEQVIENMDLSSAGKLGLAIEI